MFCAQHLLQTPREKIQRCNIHRKWWQKNQSTLTNASTQKMFNQSVLHILPEMRRSSMLLKHSTSLWIDFDYGLQTNNNLTVFITNIWFASFLHMTQTACCNIGFMPHKNRVPCVRIFTEICPKFMSYFFHTIDFLKPKHTLSSFCTYKQHHFCLIIDTATKTWWAVNLKYSGKVEFYVEKYF
jgi:hypothetical protein